MPLHVVAKASEIEPGHARRVEVDGVALLLCNVAGDFYAIEDVCTHDGGQLDQGVLEGSEIECPRHGARFDVRTGDALTLPAVVPVGTYAVSRDGEDVLVDVP